MKDAMKLNKQDPLVVPDLLEKICAFGDYEIVIEDC